MTRNIYTFLFLVCLLVPAGSGQAGESASHGVTVSVAAVSQVAVTGGDVTLTVDQYAGDGTLTALPNTNTGLVWETNESDRKITVATDLPDPAYALSVEAADVSGSSGATPSGVVTVGTQSQDLVSDIDQGSGACTLVYTAAADLAAGTQTEVHTITYTITSN